VAIFAPVLTAQTFPSRTIQIINISPPGGGGDIMGRLLVDKLTRIIGKPIITVNKAGASDTLGTDAVVKSRNDGYTIGYTSSAATVYARITMPDNLPYDPLKDLEPLGLQVFFPISVAVLETSPWKSFAALIEYAKAHPGELRVSTSGIGSTANFDLALTQSLTGAQFNHIPFKGGEAVTTALLGGHVEVTYDAFGKHIPHIASGKMRPLLLSKKMPEYPNIPTIAELGYKQSLLSGWFALFAPVGIPAEAKKFLISAIEKAVKDPESKSRIEELGYIADYKSPEEIRRLMIEDYETANALAAKMGLRK
jgi:tripartite-type tricarboxylate transporter receptor subunit TctC